MVQLEERPVVGVSASPPHRNHILLCLTSVAGLTLAVALVPWERWCVDAIDAFPRMCFSARMWSGSASLFGLLTVLLAASFVPLSIGRRWITRARISTSCLVLAAGYATALAVKVAVVLVDSGPYHAAQGIDTQPQFVGVWLGLTLVIVAKVSLLMAVGGRLSSLRSWVFAAAVIATLSAVGAAYTWSGLAWWGGPLAPPPYLGGGNGIGMGADPGKTSIFYGLIFVQNDGHLPASLDGLDMIEPSPTFQTSPAYVIAHCALGTITPRTFAQCSVPLAGWVARPGGDLQSLATDVRVPRPGLYRSGWFRIRYHVGPLHFEIFRTEELTVCAPEPGTRKCPDSGL
jgi:hypothetical protein